MVLNCFRNSLSIRSSRRRNAQSTLAREQDILTSRPLDSHNALPPPPYSELGHPKEKPNDLPSVALRIHPLAQENGVLVRAEPPREPQDAKLPHVPCDIVLVIDVSGSMGEDAPIPGQSSEQTGLSVLDLVKHACRTVLSTLDDNDRLAIITFSNWATTLQPLTVMTPANKTSTVTRINEMQPESCTNLWRGLRNGIKLFQDDPEQEIHKHHMARVPAIMVLTDGAPNHMCPGQGYVATLRALMREDGESKNKMCNNETIQRTFPSIHTFGFGYQVESGLLKSIAEFGQGNYSFIPDAGMIGTVFVHAVANLQTTYATQVCLQLKYSDSIELEQAAGEFIGQQKPIAAGQEMMSLKIPLGSLRYGQSRDVYLRWKSRNGDKKLDSAPLLHATLSCRRAIMAGEHRIAASESIFDHTTSLSPAETAYHISRHNLCAFITSIFPIDALGNHGVAIPMPQDSDTHASLAAAHQPFEEGGQDTEEEAVSIILPTLQTRLQDLIARIPASQYPHDPQCASIMHDLTGQAPHLRLQKQQAEGQITLALANPQNFLRWGRHYLLSLHGAHADQLRNSFKDPGPLQYSVNSPLFLRCRDRLNRAFDELPPPKPSNTCGDPFYYSGSSSSYPPSLSARISSQCAPGGHSPSQLPENIHAINPSGMTGRDYISFAMSMAAYNSPNNPCFAGSTRVVLANGNTIPTINTTNTFSRQRRRPRRQRQSRITTTTTTRQQTIPISRLKRGMHVMTPKGPRKVVAVLATPVRQTVMVWVEGILVTPWHPIASTSTCAIDGHDWVFPCEVVAAAAAAAAKIADTANACTGKKNSVAVRYTGTIHSVLLERDEDVDAHAIMLLAANRSASTNTGGVSHNHGYQENSTLKPIWGVTLGHGVVGTRNGGHTDDVRIHPFFGSYERVERGLKGLSMDKRGRFVSGGVERCKKTGLVCGFKGYEQSHEERGFEG